MLTSSSKYLKNKKKATIEEFKRNIHLFDITKPIGNWLCSEDKELYSKKTESGGPEGYTTEKVAFMSMIHPSKWQRTYQKRQQAKCRRFFPTEEKISNNKICMMLKVSLLKRKT